MTTYVLDSWPLLCWLHNEPAAASVDKLFVEQTISSCARLLSKPRIASHSPTDSPLPLRSG